LIDKTFKTFFYQEDGSFKMGEQQMALKVHISPCAYEMIFDKDDSLEKCMSMGVDYMQAVKDSLNKRFSDLPMFNACNFFSPKYYPTKEETCINVCEQRLARLASKFKFLEAQRDASIGELIEFVETLRQGCENKSLLEAWKCCGNINEWFVDWQLLMQLWQKILVISTSIAIAICERGFSKQNAIVKSHLQASLKLDT
jgi:hypothetical protein